MKIQQKKLPFLSSSRPLEEDVGKHLNGHDVIHDVLHEEQGKIIEINQSLQAQQLKWAHASMTKDHGPTYPGSKPHSRH